MAELTVYTSTSDGWVYQPASTNYIAIHDGVGWSKSDSGSYILIGQLKSGSDYQLYRGFLFFDTSALPDDAVITQAILGIYVQTDESDDDFDIVIRNGQPTYPHDPIEVGDYLYSQYSGNGGSLNTSGISEDAYNNITLNSDGRGWISKTGTTKLALISSKDISATPPTQKERIFIAPKEEGDAYRAKLVITYHVAPTVTVQAVTSIGQTTATGNGNITNTGGINCSKRGICWNTTGNPDVNDSKSEETDSFGTGAFSRPMTELTAEQKYYVRAYAYNSAGYSYSSQVDFTTLEFSSYGIHEESNSPTICFYVRKVGGSWSGKYGPYTTDQASTLITDILTGGSGRYQIKFTTDILTGLSTGIMVKLNIKT